MFSSHPGCRYENSNVGEKGKRSTQSKKAKSKRTIPSRGALGTVWQYRLEQSRTSDIAPDTSEQAPASEERHSMKNPPGSSCSCGGTGIERVSKSTRVGSKVTSMPRGKGISPSMTPVGPAGASASAYAIYKAGVRCLFLSLLTRVFYAPPDPMRTRG
ncbi:hypothetical protein JCGZ_24165 [Jatropha curcas]|uniref:Uncharacterized protein n=1 Tax=Jatropha curcas TaxID=180498 RepID=A0A067JP71_JATCU|nr:hypothetical protein JCGZ_24165 [Jatropha curcas]